MQHHFVAAAVPTPDLVYQYNLRVDNGQYLLGAVGPSLTVAAGARETVVETLFVGPKLQAELETTGPELDRVADYGRLTIISKPLFLLLQWVHNLTGNWGWAIVLVTVLIKLVFYPLSEASGRSMAKMRALAPRIKNIQERYKDDREQLGRQMMELYKREKINPLAGCLPIIVQIPVFLAFYWVLLESVEMRQAPFMLWIDDLSSRDPFFVLPLLMGAAMFGQYKLNPAPPDPIQAKVFMFMPIIMTVMFAWFPAGLVLYWLTNTVLSIAQQWRINRVVEAQAKKHAT
jgi:YidC/Oxa1 family membrane protein insertase